MRRSLLLAPALAAGLLQAAAFQAQAVVTQVEATFRLRLANGTPALNFFLKTPFEATGVAPVVVSGGPGAFAISFTGIDLATASSTNPYVYIPLATFWPPVGASFSLSGGLATPRIGAGVLSLLGVSGGSATASGALPLQGRIGAGASHGPAVITSLSASSFGPGVGGPLLVATTTNTGIARISLQGAPWMVGSASLHSQTANGALQTFIERGFVHGPSSGTSDVLQSGTIGLVTPIQIQSQYTGSPVFTFGVFGELTLRFVPEPNEMLLLLPGSGLLAVLGRRRRR